MSDHVSVIGLYAIGAALPAGLLVFNQDLPLALSGVAKRTIHGDTDGFAEDHDEHCAVQRNPAPLELRWNHRRGEAA